MRNRLALITALFISCLVPWPIPLSAGELPPCLIVEAELSPRSEVPAISSVLKGRFSASVEAGGIFEWSVLYPDNLDVTQAHVHLGQEGVNGGIVLFLCSNLGNGPEGTLTCPATDSFSLIHDSTPHEIIGSASQGMAAGDFFAFQRAVRQGVAYVNVHTTHFPGGLLRGQLKVTGTCEL